MLARFRFPGRTLLNGIVHLPLVMPPVVTGYLLLLTFGRKGFAGAYLEQCCGIVFSFRWTGAALAAAVMGLPLMVRAIRLTIEGIDRRLEQAAGTLGATPSGFSSRSLCRSPRPGILAGAILSFAKALGEFGATITFVSNIPGETQTIPTAIYTLTQVPGGDSDALRLTAVSIAISLAGARRLRNAGTPPQSPCRRLCMIEVDVALERKDFTLDAQFTAGAGITALFGESGSGKSTILNMIAGLLRPSRGRIAVDGRVFFRRSPGHFHPPASPPRRLCLSGCAAVSASERHAQSALRSLVQPRAGAAHRLRSGRGAPWLRTSFRSQARHPVRRRAAARRHRPGAAEQPRVLLMDEPLAALDFDRKREIIPYIEKLRDELPLPIIYVSHAVEEVARLADHVIAIDKRTHLAVGPPADILQPRGAVAGDRFARAIDPRNPCATL